MVYCLILIIEFCLFWQAEELHALTYALSFTGIAKTSDKIQEKHLCYHYRTLLLLLFCSFK